jgi:hypothetical protein
MTGTLQPLGGNAWKMEKSIEEGEKKISWVKLRSNDCVDVVRAAVLRAILLEGLD